MSVFLRIMTLFTLLALPGRGFASLAPSKATEEAKVYLENHKKDFAHQKYFSIIDYSQPSDAKRFYLIEIATGKTESFRVAHGKGSDPKFTGMATRFGDKEHSQMTSLGFFKTGETYTGKHGLSLRLIGLSETNMSAEKRAIVIHGANYVDDQRKILGRSWGCPALSPTDSKYVIEKIKGGSLLYSWRPHN